MDELIKGVFAAPIANLLVIAGLVFLGIAVVGKIPGKIEPGKTGRIASGTVGAILLVMGLAMHLGLTPTLTPTLTPVPPTPTPVSPTPTPILTPSPTPIPTPVSPTPTPTLTPSPTPIPTPTPVPCAAFFPHASDPASAPWRYVVKNNETLEDVAAAFAPFFDDPDTAWPEIYAANASVIGDKSAFSDPIPHIHSGQVLNIPNVSSPIEYQVKGNDRLEALAAQFYGKLYDNSERLWCRIYEDNKRTIGFDPDDLNPGQVLKIYPLESIEPPKYVVRPGDNLSLLAEAFYNNPGMYGPLCTNILGGIKEECDNVAPHQILELSPPPQGRPYVVQAGDSLESISEDCYGTPYKAAQIHIANRTVLGDDKWLHAGQQITLYGCTVTPTPTAGS